MQEVSEEFAQSQVVKKYHKLYIALRELVAALNVLEPGGTLLDDIKFTAREGGGVRVAYVATPIQVAIETPERKFILKVIEHSPNGTVFRPKPRRVVKEKEATL
ncbi:MAG TPA: hypothetical protein VFT53_01260 [Candidatus Saccharimonadales bacterium]|nr:hypothetical protein [Candidatus Saccharimonadales bacterium]